MWGFIIPIGVIMHKLNVPPELAVTGRIKDWLRDPSKRLPDSCRVMVVEDSMEGVNGIEESWAFVSHCLRYGAGVAVDLSKLRAKDDDNGNGLTASGPLSFAQIYSKLNEILRRGGKFKNGAVTLYLDYNHPDILEFLNAGPDILPYAKKAIYIDPAVLESPHLGTILRKVAEGSIFLAKKQWDSKGERLFSNVCMEILFKNQGSCLLSHVNLGICSPSNLFQAYTEGMKFLCELKLATQGISSTHADPSIDKQVGLGTLGLASFLAIQEVSYQKFIEALEHVVYLDGAEFGNYTPEIDLALSIYNAHWQAAKVAKQYGMERAFTVAPCARVFTDYTDSQGFTITPEISPPIAKEIDRDSEVTGPITYKFHPGVEVASEVGWEWQSRLMCAWQTMLNHTGLAHSISMNLWDDCPIDEHFMKWFIDSPMKTTYYKWVTTNFEAQDKSQFVEEDDEPWVVFEAEACYLGEECSACSE